MNTFQKISLILFMFITPSAFADQFTLTSRDIAHNKHMSSQHEFNGFGCLGNNQSPHLAWSSPPKSTKSFAITVHDADAPTGSGWWHWQIVNIPNTARELSSNAGNIKSKLAPLTSQQIKNDYGFIGFGGACPPNGHGTHHYRFTIHALSVARLDIPEGASSALVGYMIQANSIESTTIESLYQRD